MKFGVGQPVRRFEDQTLITGKGRYTDDIQLDNVAQAYVLRARVAHANIRSIDVAAARSDARRAAGADRRGREGRRARRCALPRAAQQPGWLAAPRHAAPGARDRQSAPPRPAGRVRGRRDIGAGAGCRRGDRDRLRDAARRDRCARRAGERRAATVRRNSRQSGVRLGQRHLRLRRDRRGLRQGGARHHAGDGQQPRGGELDGAAQRDRRLGCGGRAAGALHRHARLAFRARSARRSRAENPEGEAARRSRRRMSAAASA